MGINRRMEGDVLVLENTESGESIRIREAIAGGEARIEPEGDLTMDMVHDLEDELTSMVLTCRNITIDMTSVKYIANSVIKMILDVQHMVDQMDGSMRIRGVGDVVWDRFRDMGLEDVFVIERSEEILQ